MCWEIIQAFPLSLPFSCTGGGNQVVLDRYCHWVLSPVSLLFWDKAWGGGGCPVFLNLLCGLVLILQPHFFWVARIAGLNHSWLNSNLLNFSGHYSFSLFLYIRVFSLHVYCAPCSCLVPWRPEESIGFPGTGVKDGWVTTWCWELNPGTLLEQPVFFMTKLCLQP